MPPVANPQVEIFFSYAREDEHWKDEIEKHLAILKRRCDIKCWHDRLIEAGRDWSQEIDARINSAHIILLLVSADFMASDYSQEVELKRAIQREKAGEARVIPIIVRDVDWSEAEFAGLNALPRDGIPIKRWSDPDEALANVARGIRVAVAAVQKALSAAAESLPAPNPGTLWTKLVFDHRDPDVLRALDMYEERIPPGERFEVPDIVRWLREDSEQRAQGKIGPRDYFVVAKFGDRVCGFTLLHYYPAVKLAFIAYLVAEWWGVAVDGTRVSTKLLDHVSHLFATEPQLRDCTGFVLEVDDPAGATSEEEFRSRLARIRLFCALAETNGFSLRAFDIDYRQPDVRVPPDEFCCDEVPMLLMYAAPSSRISGWIERSELERVLSFICEWLYPEGFSPVPEEVQAYRGYLGRLCQRLAQGLPERVRTLSFAEIRNRKCTTRSG